jgi:hypothetical protein
MAQVANWATTNRYTSAAAYEFLDKADAFLVAHAMAGGHEVVTLEKSDANSKHRIKIPDACDAVVRYASKDGGHDGGPLCSPATMEFPDGRVHRFDVLAEYLAEKAHNLEADALKVMLTNTAPVAGNAVKAHLVEIGSGIGYAAGGAAAGPAASRSIARRPRMLSGC